tara:strand:+ start:214 stop:480 length:267 start_codon:yes stop_codon:yes gene_type:complete
MDIVVKINKYKINLEYFFLKISLKKLKIFSLNLECSSLKKIKYKTRNTNNKVYIPEAYRICPASDLTKAELKKSKEEIKIKFKDILNE